MRHRGGQSPQFRQTCLQLALTFARGRLLRLLHLGGGFQHHIAKKTCHMALTRRGGFPVVELQLPARVRAVADHHRKRQVGARGEGHFNRCTQALAEQLARLCAQGLQGFSLAQGLPPGRQIRHRDFAAGVNQTLHKTPHRPGHGQATYRHRQATEPARFERQQERHQRHNARPHGQQQRPHQGAPGPSVGHKNAISQDAVNEDHRVQRQQQQWVGVYRRLQQHQAITAQAQQTPNA